MIIIVPICTACSRMSPSTTLKDFTLSTVADNEHKQEMVSSLSGNEFHTLKEINYIGVSLLWYVCLWLLGGEIAAVAGTLSFVVLLIVSLSLIVAYCVVTGKHQYKSKS